MNAKWMAMGLAAVVGLSGCDNEEEVVVPTFETTCPQLLDAAGSKASSCLGGPKAVWAESLSDRGSFCADLQKGVTAGRRKFDGTKAAACLTAYGALSCTAFANGTEPGGDCDAMLAGAVAVGGNCFDSGECIDHGLCAIPADSCGGVCKARIAAGAACTASDSCVSGHSCQSGVCTAQPDTTGTADTGAACDGSGTPAKRCKPGLACSASNAKCAPMVREGAACTFGDHLCEPFTNCTPAGTCARNPSAGGACGVTIRDAKDEYAECLGDTWCKRASGQQNGSCVARSGADVACGSGMECSSGSCKAGKCTATCAVP